MRPPEVPGDNPRNDSATPWLGTPSLQTIPVDITELRDVEAWRESASPADTLVAVVAVFRSPRVGGRVDVDTVTGCREIVRFDSCRTRGELLTALVDADTIDLDTVRRVLTRHGWPTTLDLADAVSAAYAFVVEQRRVFLVDELVSARTVAQHRKVLADLLELERVA